MEGINSNTGTPHFIVLHFSVPRRYFIFKNQRSLGTLYQGNYQYHFFQQHLLQTSVSRFGNSHNTSDFFVIICYRDLVVTFEVTVIIVLGHHKLHLHKMTNLINVVCVLTTPDSLPFLGPKTQDGGWGTCMGMFGVP